MSLAVVSAGAVAARAEILKQEKYTALAHFHIITPIAVKTSGAFCPLLKIWVDDCAFTLVNYCLLNSYCKGCPWLFNVETLTILHTLDCV